MSTFRPRATEETMQALHERMVRREQQAQQPMASGDDDAHVDEPCLACGGALVGDPPGCGCTFILGEFLVLMRDELKANDHKGGRLGPDGWKACDPDHLLNEVVYHVAKLHGAVRAKREGLDGADAAVREHTADVANLAMMVADAAGLL